MFQTNQRKTQNTPSKHSTHFLIPINLQTSRSWTQPPAPPPQKKKRRYQSFMIPGGVWMDGRIFFKSFRVGEVVWVLQSFVDLPALDSTTATLSPTNKNSQKHWNPREVRPGWEFVPGPDGTVPYRYQCTTPKKMVTWSPYSFCVPIPKKQWTKNLSKYFLVIFRNSTGFYFCWCFC